MSARRLTAAALAAGLLLAGCGGGEDEPPGATLPPVMAEPTPSATAADVPPEAQEATPEGIAEFARFYVSERYQAYLTLEPERIRRLSTPDCEACNNFAGSVEAIAQAQGTIADSYTVEVVDVVTPGVDAAGDTATATVILRTGEFVVTAPDGGELAREPARDQLVQDLSLVRADGRWLVTGIRNA